jgi:Ca2+-transporting ATPase
LPFVFSGTLAVRGQGVAEVRAIGPKSEIGRIGQTLTEIETAPPHLTRQTARIVRVAAIAGLVCCLLVVLLYGLLRGFWLNALLAGIAVGMSMLPEEFPLVLTVFMVMGAWRMSQAPVLTRRAAAIETLGKATVLCTDKTGTLIPPGRACGTVGTAAPEPSMRCHGSAWPAAPAATVSLD